MMYEFRAKDGTELLRQYPVDKAPEIGSWVTVKGKKYQRLPPKAQVLTPNYACKGASSLPRWWPCASDHDAEGRPRFKDKKAVDEAMAKARHTGETDYGLVYDR